MATLTSFNKRSVFDFFDWLSVSTGLIIMVLINAIIIKPVKVLTRYKKPLAREVDERLIFVRSIRFTTNKPLRSYVFGRCELLSPKTLGNLSYRRARPAAH